MHEAQSGNVESLGDEMGHCRAIKGMQSQVKQRTEAAVREKEARVVLKFEVDVNDANDEHEVAFIREHHGPWSACIRFLELQHTRIQRQQAHAIVGEKTEVANLARVSWRRRSSYE